MPLSSRHRQPRRNVGVVVEAGDEDFVSGLQLAADRAAHGEGRASSCWGRRRLHRRRSAGSRPWRCALRRSWRRCGGWSRRLRRCWRCRGAGSWRWRRSRAAGLAFRRGRRGRRRGCPLTVWARDGNWERMCVRSRAGASFRCRHVFIVLCAPMIIRGIVFSQPTAQMTRVSRSDSRQRSSPGEAQNSIALEAERPHIHAGQP